MTRQAPLAAAVATYWIATALLIKAMTSANGGRFVYPLDDTYIHMAIAKNVALHHMWGVTRGAFASSTSSPLWTLLLAAAYAVAGVSVVPPIVFNLVAGTLLLVTVDRAMASRSDRPALRFMVLIAIVVLAPLPTLTVLGMEHTAHALATMWFVYAAAALMAREHPPATRDLAILGLLGALAIGFRYEGIFCVALVALFLAFRRGMSAALLVSGISAAPAVIYGAWSAAHGWYLLPNSVLLKGQTLPRTASAMVAFLAGAPAWHNLLANPHLLVLVLAALAALVVATRERGKREDVMLLSVLVGAALLHVQLARVGWFYRYDAYLVVLGIAIAGVIAAERLPRLREWRVVPGAVPRTASALLLLLVAVAPLASRGVNAWRNTPTASSNIYSQQFQMGLFLDRFYRGRTVAANDIGAVAYLADVTLVDLYGLADMDVARLKRRGAFDTGAIATVADARGAAVAVISPTWLNDSGGVPPAWTKVGEWGVRDNVVLGESAVSFYAVHENERAPLTEHLRQFAAELPVTTVQAGAYTR